MELLKTLTLKLELFAGIDIDAACRDLCELADRIGVLCEADFNGVKLWARPGNNYLELAAAWRVQMDRPAGHYKIAQVA